MLAPSLILSNYDGFLYNFGRMTFKSVGFQLFLVVSSRTTSRF